MYCIIVGGGNVGYYLTKDLTRQGHEVLLLEKDRVRASRLREELGDLVLQGDGCEYRMMADVGFGRADAIIAVTGEDEDNLIVCQMAKKQFNVPRTIARVNSLANEQLFSKLGIDTTVSSTRMIYNLIESKIEGDQTIPVAALSRGNLEIVTTDLTPHSKVVGQKLGDLRLPGDAHVVAVIRGETGLLPTPEMVLMAGDSVLSLVRTDQETELRRIFCVTGVC